MTIMFARPIVVQMLEVLPHANMIKSKSVALVTLIVMIKIFAPKTLAISKQTNARMS